MRQGLLFYVVTLFFLSFSTSAQNIPGRVARFSFNEGNAKNEDGSSIAKAYGVIWTEDRFGNSNAACYLQGNFDSYLNLGTNTDLKPECGSISLWVRIDQPIYKGSGVESNPILITRSHIDEDFNEAYIITYHYYIRKICCNTSLSETEQVHLYPPQISELRKWYHVVITYDDNYLCLYLDGKLEGKAAKGFKSVFLEGDSVMIGGYGSTKNKRCLQGIVDDIEFYNRVLEPREVQELYAAPDPNHKRTIYKWLAHSFLIAAGIMLIILAFRWRIHAAIRKEQEKNFLRNNWYEQENKVLTAQMDPHFIFNSLNTIQQFIIVNDNDRARIYLSKFSRLLRMILESNVKENVTLKEEIAIISKYLEIESLRFNKVFNYNISMGTIENAETIHIPRYLMQPFVENALWHGLLPKDGPKLLSISFEQNGEKSLLCSIDDNGVGRFYKKTNAEEKSNSFAINFIRQRLKLMSKLYHEEYTLVILDKTDETGKNTGTMIRITIPILKNKSHA